MKWGSGIIIKKLGNVMYEVKITNIPNFRNVRCHANQIRPEFSNNVASSTSSLTSILDCFDLQPESFNPSAIINNNNNEQERMETSQQDLQQQQQLNQDEPPIDPQLVGITDLSSSEHQAILQDTLL